MPNVLVYLVRHGETQENVDGIIQGQLDTKLNDTGRLQCAAVARALTSTSFAFAYTSDLARAKDVGT